MDNRELWLATTLVELADTRDPDFDEAAYSCSLAMRLAELLAPAEIAVLIADDASRLEEAAASTVRAHYLASFEARHGEGPGTDCYRTGRSVLNEPLTRASARWPRFEEAARGAGFGIVSALPMRRHDETIGVVSALGAGEHPFDTAAIGLAQVLAEAAAIAILQQRVLRRSARTAEQLQGALDSRVLIEQAKGAMAARLGIMPEAAFGLLRAFARQHNRTLAEVAGETIRGELPAHEVVAAHEARRSRAAKR
jgi:GAF domain-containing protein